MGVKSSSKTFLLAGAAAIALSGAAAGSAWAQETDGEEAAERRVVTITARKLEESLQEAPVAVSVISADAIENQNLQDLSDISRATAGLSFDNEFGRDSDRPVIRGQANILGASGVSYFIDGVRITGSISDYDLNDIERIEIVKGPQSALYGRNTYSGAINIITKSPGDEVSRRVGVEVGQFGQYEVTASVKGPLSDTVGAGLTARFYSFGGEHTNQFDGSKIGEEESMSLSGVLAFEPADDLAIRLRGYYSELDDGQAALFSQDSSQNNCFFDNGTLYGGGGRYFCGTLQPGEVNTDYEFQVGPNAGTEITTTQLSLTVEKDFNEAWSLTSITGYNEREVTMLTDGDYSPTSFQTANFVPGGFPLSIISFAPFLAVYGYPGSVVDFTFASTGEEKEFSQEIRLAYEGERFNALIGAYYLDGEDNSRDIRQISADQQAAAVANFNAELAAQQAICGFNPTCVNIVPLFGPTIDPSRGVSDLEITNKALFGLVEFELSQTTALTLEARYAEEEIAQTAIVQTLSTPGTPQSASATFEAFSPRVTFDWQVRPDNLLYAVYAEGQKPGGFNDTIAIQAGLPTFEEEEVSSFEIGSKNTLMDGQLTANFAGFFNEVTGYQLTQNARNAAGNTVSATVNAGDAEILGLEAEFVFSPAAIDGLTAIFNYAYTDAEFTQGFDENQGVLNDVLDDGLVNCSTGDQFPATSGCQSLFGSIEGKRIPRVSDNMLYADLDYRWPVLDGRWTAFTGANVSFESSKYAQVHNLIETGDATLVGLRAGMTNGPITFRVWGKNVFDEDATSLALRYADANDSFKRSFVGIKRRGSQFGFNVSAEF